MAFRVRCFLLLMIVVIGSWSVASGQLTVINVPSTDTLQERMFYIEVDAIVKPKKFEDGGFQAYGYRTVYGLDRKTEIGISYFQTRNGVDSPKELQLSVKRKVYENEKHGVASTVGATAFVPLNKSAGDRVPVMTYANVSKTFGSVKGLRLTGGGYKVFNGGRDFGKSHGFLVAIEQPLFARTSFVADWATGKNRLGYAAVGLNIAITKRQFLMPSWNIANGDGAGNYIGVFYGITF